MTPKLRIFLALAVPLVLADCTTKQLIVAELGAEHVSHEVLGGFFRFTLAFNRDAAFGITLGPYSRLGFSVLAALAIVFLLRLLRETAPIDRLRAAALALVAGGAAGNLLDRLVFGRGVVDFIDIGIGRHRFWTFNLADFGVTTGALLLVLVLWKSSAPRPEAKP